MNADGKVFDLCEILNGLTLHFAQFKQMCIPAGCDHLKNWRGIGIHKACDMAAGDRDVLDALISKGADDEYCENFKMALAVVKHQTVFNLESCSTRLLDKWESDSSIGIHHLCRLVYSLQFVFLLEFVLRSCGVLHVTEGYPLVRICASSL
ncbi:Rad2 nuclease [Porites harrisoni]